MKDNSLWKTGDPGSYATFAFETNQKITIMEAKGKVEINTSTKGAAVLEFPIAFWETERKILINAINNRTRERNYANLCLRLSEGELSDEEFEREIMNNQNRYVISFQDESSPEEIFIASQLSRKVLDVDTVDDFKELFSISSHSLDNLIKSIEKK